MVSPPLASSPGGAQSDKVFSSASMSTRVAPRDHVNSPAKKELFRKVLNLIKVKKCKSRFAMVALHNQVNCSSDKIDGTEVKDHVQFEIHAHQDTC